MNLVDILYEKEDPKHNILAWNKFPFLSPSFTYLKAQATLRALINNDRSYPIDAFKFDLFPDETDEEVTDNLRACMNRGIGAVNSLTERHLGGCTDDETLALLKLEEIPGTFDLFSFIREAREVWERGTTGVRRVEPKVRVKAYASMSAMELGYRVGTIDASPDVQNSLIYFDQVVDRLKHLLGFTNPQAFTSEWDSGPSVRFDTRAEVTIYGKDSEEPIRSRLKYLDEGHPKYPSILMKIYRDLEYPSEIRDYMGVEFIVEDDAARDRLVSYFRNKTRATRTFEGFKDATKGKKLSGSSSRDFGVKKFVLRVPVKLDNPIEHASGRISYEMIPTEVQILTLDDAMRRDLIPEASHIDYKKRQYAQVFPVLFPRELYKPLLVGGRV